ncbi:MAG: hypothetical protein ACT4OV_07985 [Microthrixaceae bacterium]
MSEPDDELARLHAADPVDQASLPSASDPKARVLFERIIMSDSDLPTTTSTTSTRQRLVMAAAAAVAVVLLVAGGLALAGNDGSGDVLASTTPTAAPGGGPINPGGSSLTSCVELYDLQTLANREVAFDGTVASVDGDDVTFTVNRWYRGGDGAEVTLAGASTLGGVTSAGEPTPLGPGTRLLVAGDGGFAWSCGFTQPYDDAIAAEWAATLAG